MTEDIAAKIREALADMAGFDPDGDTMAKALRSVLERHHNGDGHLTCRHCVYAWPCPTVRTIAEDLGISVSPLRGPSDQSGAGVRPRSGDQNSSEGRPA